MFHYFLNYAFLKIVLKLFLLLNLSIFFQNYFLSHWKKFHWVYTWKYTFNFTQHLHIKFDQCKDSLSHLIWKHFVDFWLQLFFLWNNHQNMFASGNLSKGSVLDFFFLRLWFFFKNWFLRKRNRPSIVLRICFEFTSKLISKTSKLM